MSVINTDYDFQLGTDDVLRQIHKRIAVHGLIVTAVFMTSSRQNVSLTFCKNNNDIIHYTYKCITKNIWLLVGKMSIFNLDDI